MLKTNYLNLNNGIFQGDTRSTFLFCIAQKPIFSELKNTDYGYKTTTRKLNPLFFMDNLDLYAKK